MKTAIALIAATLSVAALSTNASAQKLMLTAGIKAPKLVANIGGTTYMTGSAGGTSWREVNGLPSPATFLTGGADTSFGTRSGGGFKLASETDEANPNDSPGPWSGYSTAEKPSKIVQPTTGLLFADFMNGSNGSSSDDAYALIGSMLGGSASPGDETEEYGDPIASEAEAAKTFDYCVIYPERCTVSQIERPTFGPHMVTFDNIAGSADPRDDDV